MKKILPHIYSRVQTVWGNDVEMLILERETINSKPILQLLWRGWYKEIEPFISKDGLNIEVGAGGGYASTYFKNLIQTDVVKTPHINMCCDASAFPFKNIDEFFNEARRVLKKGGRILMVEPYVSYLSYPVWKLLHYEGCNLKSLSIDSNEHARIDANIAIPTILFKKKRKQFEKNYANLKIIYENYHTAFHFFASGGYTYPSLIPKFLLPNLVRIEKTLQPLGKWLGSFMTVIIQKD